jgi:CDP-diacylglycerol--glycerol-3-phosphate 3-phosphatidyltransferase/cardiolipin synthase
MVGLYRARDAVSIPSLISWTRLPLALAFPQAIHDPTLAIAILALAGASDVLDGWAARRFGWVTPMGAVVDPVTDKLFVLTVVLTLVYTHKLPALSVLLLGTREIGEAPLVVWYAFSERLRRGRVRAPMANVTGKLATVLQFATVALAIVGSPETTLFLHAAAISGVIAAASYLVRTLSAYANGRDASLPPGRG